MTDARPLMLSSLSETSFELEKISREFSILPRAFLGALIDKFMGGSLGGKGWPAGTIKVAELFTLGWMAPHIKKELYEGEH